MAGIVLFLWGLSAYAETSLPLWAGLLLLLAFILHESRSYHPLLPLYIFRSVSFSMSNLAAFIQYSATYALSFLLSLYLQVLTGLSPAVSGLILLVQPIIMALLSPKAGALSDAYGPMPIATAGLALTTLGLACFAVCPDASVAAVAAFLVLIGTGSALFGAPNNSAIMSSVKPAYHGVASSMLALARNLGHGRRHADSVAAHGGDGHIRRRRARRPAPVLHAVRRPLPVFSLRLPGPRKKEIAEQAVFAYNRHIKSII